MLVFFLPTNINYRTHNWCAKIATWVVNYEIMLPCAAIVWLYCIVISKTILGLEQKNNVILKW